jgi:PAS domain S-box-containing protein
MSGIHPSDLNGGFPRDYLQVILDNMLDMICQVSVDGIYQYVSPSHKSTLGYQPEELIGRSIFEFMHPDDLNSVFKAFNTAKSNKTSGKAEYRYRHKNGHYIWLESVGKPLFNDKGDIKGAIITSRDVTERRQMKDMINENENSLRVLINSMPIGILLIDPISHKIEDANIDAAKMVGEPIEELLGKICHEYICPAEKGRCPITDLNNEVDHSEKILLTASGTQIPILKSVNSINLNQRKHLLECFVDITAQKKTENRLTKLTECFLSFGSAPEENIRRLVSLCGEELGAACALYSRLKGDMLCVAGQWNAPLILQ